jgi:hypothetical protein
MAVYTFHNKRPSQKQVIGCLMNDLKAGDTLTEVIYGESSLTFQYEAGRWTGWGWIKKLGGDNIAQVLNNPPPN